MFFLTFNNAVVNDEVLVPDHDPQLEQDNLVLSQLVSMSGFLSLALCMVGECLQVSAGGDTEIISGVEAQRQSRSSFWWNVLQLSNHSPTFGQGQLRMAHEVRYRGKLQV